MVCDVSNDINIGKKLSKICHRLAHPDVKIRSKGIKDVGKFIVNTPIIGTGAMKKLAIAIYFYIWSTDMPINQRQVSVKIAQLHNSFGDYRKSFSYFRAIFFALAENWSMIDKFRSDKMLLFVRIMVAEVLGFIHKSRYNKQILNHFSKLIQDPNGICSEKATGLTMHVIEVFIPEYKATIHENPTTKAYKGILLPFVKLSLGNNMNIVKHIHNKILTCLGDVFDNRTFLKSIVKKINMSPNKQARSLMEKTLKLYENSMDIDEVFPPIKIPKVHENIQSVLKNNCKNEHNKNKDLKVVFNLKNNKTTAFYKNQPPAKISSIAESVC